MKIIRLSIIVTFLLILVISCNSKGKHSLEDNILYKDENNFKNWLRDTLVFIKNDTHNDEPGCTYRQIVVSQDSLLLEISYRINSFVNPNKILGENSILALSIERLKDENVYFSNNEYDVEIEYTERFELSFSNLIFDKSYEYSLLSFKEKGKNETINYSLVKGNLIDSVAN